MINVSFLTCPIAPLPDGRDGGRGRKEGVKRWEIGGKGEGEGNSREKEGRGRRKEGKSMTEEGRKEGRMAVKEAEEDESCTAKHNWSANSAARYGGHSLHTFDSHWLTQVQCGYNRTSL